MTGKAYVAFTDWWSDNRQDFHGVFSSGLKAKEIFGPERKWKRVVHDDGSWCWASEGDCFDYLVYKVNMNERIGWLE